MTALNSQRQSAHRNHRTAVRFARRRSSHYWAAGYGLPDLRRPEVHFGDVDGSIVVSSDQFIVARVPEGATSGGVVVATNGHRSNSREVHVAVPIADSLHPVANPAVDADGNIYATFSGSRGQKVPVAIYRIDDSQHSQAVRYRDDESNRHGLRT